MLLSLTTWVQFPEPTRGKEKTNSCKLFSHILKCSEHLKCSRVCTHTHTMNKQTNVIFLKGNKRRNTDCQNDLHLLGLNEPVLTEEFIFHNAFPKPCHTVHPNAPTPADSAHESLKREVASRRQSWGWATGPPCFQDPCLAPADLGLFFPQQLQGALLNFVLGGRAQ